jgi:hypothetical protein
MATFRLRGRVTEEGELDIELPAGLPAGEVRITLEIPAEPAWTADELDRALQVVPLTGAEIVRGGLTGGWAERGISDGEAWVHELRQRRREERGSR